MEVPLQISILFYSTHSQERGPENEAGTTDKALLLTTTVCRLTSYRAYGQGLAIVLRHSEMGKGYIDQHKRLNLTICKQLSGHVAYLWLPSGNANNSWRKLLKPAKREKPRSGVRGDAEILSEGHTDQC